MMESHHLPHSIPPAPPAAERFQMLVNGKPFVANSITGRSCWRAELASTPSRRIWKILASGRVARQGTSIGLYIDQSLTPGVYDLVDNTLISVVYHLTPRKVARVLHSRAFQRGRLALLECDPSTQRLRGTFDFSLPSSDFHVTAGKFDLQWTHDPAITSAQ